jgi:hypothetical protein
MLRELLFGALPYPPSPPSSASTRPHDRAAANLAARFRSNSARFGGVAAALRDAGPRG